MNYFINNIFNEQPKTLTAINIIIFMLTKPVKNNSIYFEFHSKLKEIILKILYSNKKNISTIGNILSEYPGETSTVVNDRIFLVYGRIRSFTESLTFDLGMYLNHL